MLYLKTQAIERITGQTTSLVQWVIPSVPLLMWAFLCFVGHFQIYERNAKLFPAR